MRNDAHSLIDVIGRTLKRQFYVRIEAVTPYRHWFARGKFELVHVDVH
jgi:hypothetical protein